MHSNKDTHRRESITLIEEIIAEPLDDHVALAGCHWFIIDSDDQGHIGLLNSNTSGSLLPSDNSSRFALDHHVFCATKVQSSRSKRSRFRKVIHDASDFFWLELREIGALGPNAAVVGDDSGGREMVSFDFTHQVIIYVSLPRHLLLPSLVFKGFYFFGCVF